MTCLYRRCPHTGAAVAFPLLCLNIVTRRQSISTTTTTPLFALVYSALTIYSKRIDLCPIKFRLSLPLSSPPVYIPEFVLISFRCYSGLLSDFFCVGRRSVQRKRLRKRELVEGGGGGKKKNIKAKMQTAWARNRSPAYVFINLAAHQACCSMHLFNSLRVSFVLCNLICAIMWTNNHAPRHAIHF